MLLNPAKTLALSGRKRPSRRHKDKWDTAPRRPTSSTTAPADCASRQTQQVSRWRRAAEDAARATWIPRHVHACRNNELPGAPWFLAVWERSNPAQQTRIPYTCGSYRCPSESCQRAAAHLDFARLNEALERVDDSCRARIVKRERESCVRVEVANRRGLVREIAGELRKPANPGFVFFVLTIDQHGTQGTKHFADEQEAFRALSENTRYLLKQLRREQERRGWEVLKNEWVATVEVQRNGWPHINLIVRAPELAAELRKDEETLEDLGVDERGRKLVRGRVGEFVRRSKWGPQSTAEAVRSREALAGYVTKLAGEAPKAAGRYTGEWRGTFAKTAGEVAKLTQAPTNARMKLRRIRAGKGFLPPRKKDSSYTGVMTRHVTEYGVTCPETLVSPFRVRPSEPEPKKREGETKESYARRHCDWVIRGHRELENYLVGVRIALDNERAYIRAEFAGMVREVNVSELREQAERRRKPDLRLIQGGG